MVRCSWKRVLLSKEDIVLCINWSGFSLWDRMPWGQLSLGTTNMWYWSQGWSGVFPTGGGCLCDCDTGIHGVLSESSSSPAELWMRAFTMQGNLCFLTQIPAAQGDAWVRENISSLLFYESFLRKLFSQKAMTNLLSSPREAVPARNTLGSEKYSVKNIRENKWRKIMISCFSAMCMYNKEPWEWGHVSRN